MRIIGIVNFEEEVVGTLGLGNDPDHGGPGALIGSVMETRGSCPWGPDASARTGWWREKEAAGLEGR